MKVSIDRAPGRSYAPLARGLRTAATLAVAALGSALAAEAPADLVLTGGAVYTVDAARSWAEAVAIRDGRIV